MTHSPTHRFFIFLTTSDTFSLASSFQINSGFSWTPAWAKMKQITCYVGRPARNTYVSSMDGNLLSPEMTSFISSFLCFYLSFCFVFFFSWQKTITVIKKSFHMLTTEQPTPLSCPVYQTNFPQKTLLIEKVCFFPLIMQHGNCCCQHCKRDESFHHSPRWLHLET